MLFIDRRVMQNAEYGTCQTATGWRLFVLRSQPRQEIIHAPWAKLCYFPVLVNISGKFPLMQMYICPTQKLIIFFFKVTVVPVPKNAPGS